MANRTKVRFISDIHMGDNRSFDDPNPYGWFRNNIPVLAKFLDDQLKAPNLKELVILGDLFDQWVIPTDLDPLISFDKICSYKGNQPIIRRLKKLAANPDIKLAYVPGNHDMSLDKNDIAATKQILENTFPGIRFFCNSTIPLGSYNVGTLAAEHGDRYCLFNAPDPGSKLNTFLPIGYFISRVVAYKVKNNGYKQNPRQIFIDFLKKYIGHPHLIEAVFGAIAKDAGLTPKSKIILKNIPGCPDTMTIKEIGQSFSNLVQRWDNTPGNINTSTAILSDLGYLYYAASSVYFSHFNPNIDIVIFGHTHVQKIKRNPIDPAQDSSKDPCYSIYANCGTWVDKCKDGCTYVETERIPSESRHYVRVKGYPGNALIDDGYVLI
jgi:UDP-2,3-diacylglucosamine pyrophosphatase LpxH